LANKAERLSRERPGGWKKAQTNASKLPGLCVEDMQGAGFFLADVCRNKNAMKSFGYVQAKGDDRLQFNHPRLPKFFGCHLNYHWVVENTRVVLGNLKVKRGGRNFCLGFDETTFAPGYSGTFFYICVIHFEFVCPLQQSK
jgi:hypothetical protein